jgi:hypothetical protein
MVFLFKVFQNFSRTFPELFQNFSRGKLAKTTGQVRKLFCP